MVDPSGFLAAAVTKRGVSVSKEGTQYVCTVTAENEHGNLDADPVFTLAREYDLQVDTATASIDRGELYVYVDTNPTADGGGD